MTERDTANNRDSQNDKRKPRRAVHDRLLAAAYDLFTHHGIAQVGIDAVIAKSGCAKASLYNQFGSKEGLALSFLELREALWTREWLQAEIMRRATTPEGRLLAVFELFDEWFEQSDFEGCTFVNVLLESAPGSPIRQAAADHLTKVREIMLPLAEAAGLQDPERFTRVWYMLMMGSIVSACEGDQQAAREVSGAAKILLENWLKARDENPPDTGA